MNDYKATVRWLWRYQSCLRQEKELALEVVRLRAEAEHVTPLLTGMPGGGANTDKLSCAVERLITSQQRLECQINRGQAVRGEIVEAINHIQDQRDHEILRRRYLLGQKWETIACALPLDYRNVTRRHHRAVEKIALLRPKEA